MKGKLKQTKGITLVVLLITIIILLTLAMLTIKKCGETTKKWTQTEEGITDGTVTLHIGDIVNYNAKSNGEKTYTPKIKNGAGSTATYNSTTEKYDLTTKEYKTEDLTWRVLGVNDKGKLELISSTTNETLYLANVEGYLHGAEELNTFCSKLYGQGMFATEARSVTVDDINKITGYDPKTYNRYGTEYEYTRGTFIKNGEMVTASDSNIVKLTSEYYEYSGKSEIEKTSKEYDMLFKNTDHGKGAYWLASTCVLGANARTAYFCVRNVNSGNIGLFGFLYISDSSSYESNYGVRAVVSLSSNIQLSGNSENGWTIQK